MGARINSEVANMFACNVYLRIEYCVHLGMLDVAFVLIRTWEVRQDKTIETLSFKWAIFKQN